MTQWYRRLLIQSQYKRIQKQAAIPPFLPDLYWWRYKSMHHLLRQQWYMRVMSHTGCDSPCFDPNPFYKSDGRLSRVYRFTTAIFEYIVLRISHDRIVSTIRAGWNQSIRNGWPSVASMTEIVPDKAFLLSDHRLNWLWAWKLFNTSIGLDAKIGFPFLCDQLPFDKHFTLNDSRSSTVIKSAGVINFTQ